MADNYVVELKMNIYNADGSLYTEAMNKNYVMDKASMIFAERAVHNMVGTFIDAAEAALTPKSA